MLLVLPLLLALADIKAHYAGSKGLDAEIVQTKTSTYLVKPLVSKIHLAAHPGEVVWEVKEPVAAKFVFDESGKQSPFPDNAKTQALISFIRALVTVDFDKLERDFTLETKGSTLVATPRAASPLSGMIKGMELVFADDLRLKTMTITAENETTRLEFKSLTLLSK